MQVEAGDQELKTAYPQLEWFDYNHLSHPSIRRVSQQFCVIAWAMAREHGDKYSRELSKCLDNLLAAKDCAVRAQILVDRGG